MVNKTQVSNTKGCVCERVCTCQLTSVVSSSAALWTVACQAPLSMGFSRQEYRSGLPFPSSGHLPDSGIEPTSSVSPALSGRFFTTSATWEALGSNEASPNSPWEGHPSPSAHSLLLSFFSLAVGAMCPLIPPEYKLRDNRHLICLIYHSSLHAQDHCLAYFRTVGSV